MPSSPLPRFACGPCITDGGLETTLIFHYGMELPDFAAFPLVETDSGRQALRRYYEPYLDLAQELDITILLDTPTWRASHDWGVRAGFDGERLADVNRGAVRLLAELISQRPDARALVSGAIGPRGDGCVVGEQMTAAQAEDYHAPQVQALTDGGAAMASVLTLSYPAEAVGVARAATAAGLPVVVSFTVETDGALPSGLSLADAVRQVDDETDAAPIYYMVNCAHPVHLQPALVGTEPWLERVQGVRANASRRSHAELDEATDLDRGDLDDLADGFRLLAASLPDLRVVGGCCGTDHEHVAAVAATVRPTDR